MSVNPLRHLASRGQSIWLDDLHRGLIESGELDRLIREDGVAGLTSNPAILAQALRGRAEYREAVRAARGRRESAQAIFEALAIADVRSAADSFRPVYEATGAQDGYVSMEVSPLLADDAPGTSAEARALWQRIGRPNVMIKVPATPAGLEAIPDLLVAGINLNVTLLFSVRRHAAVIEGFFDALEVRLRRGEPLQGVASVASFFVSRIDTLVDARLDAVGTTVATALRGTTAIACAKLAYQEYLRGLKTQRWMQLAALGAQPQRLLWASVSTKDRAYHDLKYVEPLIAPDTIVTMPIATLAAFRDHGRPSVGIDDDLEGVRAVGSRLAPLGIRLDDLARELLTDGVRRFVASHDRLLAALARYAMDITKGGLTRGHP